MKALPLILIIKDGLTLCKDGKLYDRPCFGTPRWTARTYRSQGHAIRTAKRIGGKVAVIPVGVGLSGGIVIERKPCPDKPNYETIVHHKIEEFFLP
jgi:hypothetical protein